MQFVVLLVITAIFAIFGMDQTRAQPIPETGISDDDVFDGWISLFDGNSLYGWKPESKADWKVTTDGITVSDGEAGLLRTTTQFDDFILRLEFRAGATTNSGVFVRTSPRPVSPQKGCYEINIAPPDNPYPTGSIVGRKKSTLSSNLNSDRWHQLQITCVGNQVSVDLDGKPAASWTDPSPLGRGFIGLQLNDGKIAFRNIRLKPLHLVEIFNGKNLAGWNTYPEMKSRFSVEAGQILVKDGPGQLETKDLYANFIFQGQIKTESPGLNSGIFFRCIPTEKMNGYESQIHNGILNSNRSQPKDCGTGGIFRRKDARFVVADDQEWFIKTIIADGPHISTWVNGVQVCDWTDKRKPDANPRRGLREKAGSLMIQGHDPTTNIRLRDLKIREISVRHPPQ